MRLSQAQAEVSDTATEQPLARGLRYIKPVIAGDVQCAF